MEKTNITGYLKKYETILGPNDYSFVTRVYMEGTEKYRNRLKAIGFENKKNILDAGCGFGQWSLAMAEINENIYASDVSNIRLEVIDDVTKHLGIKNISTAHGTLVKLPYEDNFFDAIFCYGAIFIADPVEALKEFMRILKPGGILYTNANAIGFQINLWFNSPNATADYNPKMNVAKAFQNTANYFNGLPKGDGQIIIEKEQFIEMLKKSGYKNIICEGEGLINISNDKNLKVTPFFKDEYMGLTGVYEVLASK